MPVILATSKNIPNPSAYDLWFSLTGSNPCLHIDQKFLNLASRLEAAFVKKREDWWRLGRKLAKGAGSEFAIAPTSATFGSDFGVMLAWHNIISEFAASDTNYLAICDDPWLYRQMMTVKGVSAGRPPFYRSHLFSLAVRGFLARGKVAFLCLARLWRFQRLRDRHGPGDKILLVYGHPDSSCDGTDAYFGDLMKKVPSLKRMLHTDCPSEGITRLSNDGRTCSLHAWGSMLYCFRLLFARWRPDCQIENGAWHWLIKRAAVIENSGGSIAMNKWQAHCQERWISLNRPSLICWPWENLGWERNLCREANRIGIKTIGYQHTVVGPHQLNYNLKSNFDGLESVPDRIVANGPAYFNELLDRGVPGNRLCIGGAFRFSTEVPKLYNPNGPILFPLSGIRAVAQHQLEAGKMLALKGYRILVKEHPMYPVSFNEVPNLVRTEKTLLRQKSLSAVVYCSGTSGLEARLAGVPAFRLLLEDRISIDVLPKSISNTAAAVNDLEKYINTCINPDPVPWASVLAPVNWSWWLEAFSD